jgi:hypothetical protein
VGQQPVSVTEGLGVFELTKVIVGYVAEERQVESTQALTLDDGTNVVKGAYVTLIEVERMVRRAEPRSGVAGAQLPLGGAGQRIEVRDVDANSGFDVQLVNARPVQDRRGAVQYVAQCVAQCMHHAGESVCGAGLPTLRPQPANQELPGNAIMFAKCEAGEQHRGLAAAAHPDFGSGFADAERPQ